jgi:hypothetical protein
MSKGFLSTLKRMVTILLSKPNQAPKWRSHALDDGSLSNNYSAAQSGFIEFG